MMAVLQKSQNCAMMSCGENVPQRRGLSPVRCPYCQRTQFEADIRDGTIRRRCHKCGHWFTLEVRPDLRSQAT